MRVCTRPRGYLWTALALPRLAAEDDLDVLHVQYITPLRSPCPVVTTIHDISFRLYPEWFSLKDRLVMNTFIPRGLKVAAVVITPSESAASNIRREYDYPQDRIVVTPEAADDRFFDPPGAIETRRIRDKFGIEGRYMLYVGNLQPRKNASRLIEAFVSAREVHGIRDQLLIAGQFGWKYNADRLAVEQARQAGHVCHLGYVNDDDLPALYSEATAFVFPTLHEGFGLPVLEAMASGTPVLTSTVSSLPEIAGDAALLVDPTDESAIAEGIAQLATDRDLRRRLVSAGRDRAKQFSWDDTARATLQAYRAAVEG
jgi:glycosyltransferase involved in cell wall biosynthesis